ncbi:MAG: hypothetical protein N2C14_16570, partial [Planctomycetales bacterium]
AAHERWKRELPDVSPDSAAREILDLSAKATELNVIAAADAARIKLHDAGLDPQLSLHVYRQAENTGARPIVNLEKLTGLWKVGGFWKTIT